MRNRPLILGLGVLGLSLSASAHARIHYDRPINIITSNYDLVDTTYIDRGRLDGVKVGDKFAVKFRDGKLATQVIVTGVFDRMASVKIVDSWLLKNGQLANFDQRPMVVALQSKARRPAPDITVKPKASSSPASAPAVAASAPAPTAPEMPPAAPGVEPGAATAPTAAPSAPAGPLDNLPGAPGGSMPPSPDMGLPPSPDASSMPPAPDASAGLPPAPGGDMGLPPAPGGDTGLPPAPGGDMGLPPAPGGDMGIPPPPM